MITFGVHPTPLYSHTFMYTTQRRARQTARIENERAMRQFCRSLSMGLGKDAVVVLGDKDVTKSRFYRPRPHRRLLRELSRHSNLVIVGEYYSSQKCAFCGRHKANSGDAWIGDGPVGSMVCGVAERQLIVQICACTRDANSPAASGYLPRFG